MQNTTTYPSSQLENDHVQHGSTTWRALTTLATEHQHVLRHLLDGRMPVANTGEVHHHHETNDPNSSLQRAQPLSQQLLDGTQIEDRSSKNSLHGLVSHKAVQAEVNRVQAKVLLMDPETTVVLRLEYIRGTASRAAALAISIAIMIGATVLLAEFIKKTKLGHSDYYFRKTTLYAWNTAVAVVCLVILTTAMATLLWQLYIVSTKRKTWSPRVKASVIFLTMEAAVQWVNLVFYLAPNVYVLQKPCYIFAPFTVASGFVQWTCWNTIFMLFLAHAYGCQQRHKDFLVTSSPFGDPMRYGEVIVDRGMYTIWPCLIPWLLFEADMGYAWLHHLRDGPGGLHEAVTLCEAGQETFSCYEDNGTRYGIYVSQALACIYFALTCGLLLRKLSYIKKLPYAAAKRGIVYFTLQLWLRLGVMAYFELCMVLLWLVRNGTCASNEFVDTGVMPMHVVMTINAVVFCYISTPVNPAENAAARKLWLQEVAWTEADKPVKLAARSAMIPNDAKMEQQPVFCSETMLNLLYWSCLVYDHDRGNAIAKNASAQLAADAIPQAASSGARTILTLETAMSLYGLTESESFWEVKQDTRCLVSWGHRHVVVAFRGTASITNALADLQAWRIAHPPSRGTRCMGTRPLVHVGFLKSWLAGGLNEKVTSAVLRAVQLCRKSLDPDQRVTIFVTGHSLGGAMATLAAYDIRTGLQAKALDNVEVVCYNFAAPRTGNHAFAREYNAMVPDTWSVINDQDIVTREGKLLFLYKRPGRRVIVDAKGRLIVRPTYLEASVQRGSAGQGMTQHLLVSYFHAVLSVALAQFGSNGFPDGMAGIIRLAEASPYVQDVLGSQMGMRLADMKHYSELNHTERAQSVLPGSHPPVKGFYLIKPTPVTVSAKAIGGSSRLLSRMRYPKASSSANSLVPSASLSEITSVPATAEADALDGSCSSSMPNDSPEEDSAHVLVDIDEVQLSHGADAAMAPDLCIG